MTECQTNGPEATQTNQIIIVVNGESRSVPPNLSIRALLECLSIDASRVAVELDRVIVRQPEWSGTMVGDGAQLEIVQFVGGG